MWKRLSTKELLKHPRITVLEDQVELPNGHQTDYIRFEVVGTSVIAIVINDKNQILLQKEYSYPINDFIYQFPGGGVPDGEDLKEGIRREIIEETGFNAQTIQPIGSFYNSIRRSDSQAHAFIATDLKVESTSLDLEESIEVYWFSEAEIDHMIKQNIIKHNATLTTWAFYKVFKN